MTTYAKKGARRRFAAAYPGWSDPRAMLARFVRSEPILARLSADLAAIRKP